MDESQALDWDMHDAQAGESYELLEPGDYLFKVENLERSYYEGSEKIPACPVAILKLSLSNPQGGHCGTLRDRIYLTTAREWKIAQFFEALNYPKNEETGRVSVNWATVEGKEGWLEIDKVASKRNKEKFFNNVKRYYTPDAWDELTKKYLPQTSNTTSGW